MRSLFEIFDRSHEVDLEWDGFDVHATFEVDGAQYVLQFIPMSEGDMFHGEMPDQPITENTCFFAFAAITGTGAHDQETNLGHGQAIAVFAIVMKELEKYVDRNNMDTVYFGCSLNKPKRKQLYERFIRKYTRMFPWKQVGEAQAEFFGDMKQMWIVQRNEIAGSSE